MKIETRHETAFWLVISVALLSSLIPGGPVENRDFSHIHPGVLGAFNVFLTTLDIGSVVLAYFAVTRRRWALSGAFYAGVAFFGVYAVDLAQVFPQSPTPMSFALSLIEVLGMTAAVPLMFAARRGLSEEQDQRAGAPASGARYAIAASLVAVGIAVVWFATESAMESGLPGSSAVDTVAR